MRLREPFVPSVNIIRGVSENRGTWSSRCECSLLLFLLCLLKERRLNFGAPLLRYCWTPKLRGSCSLQRALCRPGRRALS